MSNGGNPSTDTRGRIALALIVVTTLLAWFGPPHYLVRYAAWAGLIATVVLAIISVVSGPMMSRKESWLAILLAIAFVVASLVA